jgi:hypothetical protein
VVLVVEVKAAEAEAVVAAKEKAVAVRGSQRKIQNLYEADRKLVLLPYYLKGKSKGLKMEWTHSLVFF